MNNAVPSADVIKAAEELANRILKGAPMSVVFIKEAINKGVELPLEEGLRLEADLSALVGSTEDAKKVPGRSPKSARRFGKANRNFGLAILDFGLDGQTSDAQQITEKNIGFLIRQSKI